MIKRILLIIGIIIIVIIILPFLPTQFGLNFIGASTIDCSLQIVDKIQCNYSSQGFDSPGWTYLASSGQNNIDLKGAGICAGHVSQITYRHSRGTIEPYTIQLLMSHQYNFACDTECEWRERDRWLREHDAYALTPGLTLEGIRQFVAMGMPPIEDCFDFWIKQHKGFGEAEYCLRSDSSCILGKTGVETSTSCKMEQTSTGRVNVFFSSPCTDEDCEFDMTCNFEKKAQICIANQKRCAGANVEKCSPNGLEWQIVEQCSEGCAVGECKEIEEAPEEDEGVIDTIEEIFTPEEDVIEEEFPIDEELAEASDFCGDRNLDLRVENCNTCPQDCNFFDKLRQFWINLKTIFRSNR